MFSKVNTCNSTASSTSSFSLISFQGIKATNITFSDNDFCNINLFANNDSLDSSSFSAEFNQIKLISNRFNDYTLTSGILLNTYLLKLDSSTKITLSDIEISENTRNVFTPIYYILLYRVGEVTISGVSLADETLFGLADIEEII